jgi:hypothetical protein
MMYEMSVGYRWVVAAVLLVGGSSVAAPPLAAQQVELIGLKRWTVQMIKDSLVKYVPGADTTLTSRACGASIHDLGFPRTASIVYPTRDIVMVVEPQDSARAAANPIIPTTSPLPPDWQALLDPMVASTGQFTNNVFPVALKLYPLIQDGKRDSIDVVMQQAGGAVPPQFDSVWTFLQRHATPADLRQAIAVLDGDSAYTHRALAMGVLANFAAHDEAWWALVHALRDPHPAAANPSLIASQVLLGWLSQTPRHVDWSRRVEDLHALFAGANLWVLPTVMQVLTYTKVDASLAHAILADNAQFVVGFARSGDPTASAVGRKLLMQLGAPDYADDGAKWERWANAL